LVEARETAWRALLGVLGLVAQREVGLWKGWRPWVAGFGVALPSSFLLMGASVTVTWSYARLLCPELLAKTSLTKPSGLLVLLCQAVLLIGWSWTSGFVVGSVSRRTLWASMLLCCSPCLFCLLRFGMESLPRFCLLLFVLPAIWGVHQGLRVSRMNLQWAVVIALGVTLLMMPSWSNGSWHWWRPSAWSLNWLLIWPAWFLVATARKARRQVESA
jgi:hypothetical protein